MKREEHLEWCKKRALDYIDRNDAKEAFASMLSDMGKHEETQGHKALEMGMTLLMGGMMSSDRQVRDWIVGFN